MFWQRCLKKVTTLTGGEDDSKSKSKKKSDDDEEEEEVEEAGKGEGEGEGEGEEGAPAEEAPEEAKPEGAEPAEGEAVTAAAAPPAGAPPAQPGKRVKKLLNAFNFCERAAMTYNNPYRVSTWLRSKSHNRNSITCIGNTIFF